MKNEVHENKSIHVKNEIKYQIVRRSLLVMRIVKQSNQHIKISGLCNNDKILGVNVNKMIHKQVT